MVIINGRGTAFAEFPYDLSSRGGPVGISRKVTVSAGPSGELRLKLPETIWNQFTPAVMDFFRGLSGPTFGAHVTALCGRIADNGIEVLALRVVDAAGTEVYNTLPIDEIAAALDPQPA